MTLPSYPFPASTAVPRDEVVFDPHRAERDEPYEQQRVTRMYGREAVLLRTQYFGVEDRLLTAFRFVAPSEDNANCFSTDLASIVREAANVYEIACRSVYEQLFVIRKTVELNVFNFLSLECFLGVAPKRLVLLCALDTFPKYPEVAQPFRNLATWNRQANVERAHVPIWWDGYNELKHGNQGIQKAGSLANAIAAVGALFQVLDAIYGWGFVSGIQSLPDVKKGFVTGARSSLIFSSE